MTWEPTHRSVHDGSVARLTGIGANSIVLENECGDSWVALPGDWERMDDEQFHSPLTTDERHRIAARLEDHPLGELSWNVARYTRAILDELHLTGKVERPPTRIWRSRIHNAARKVGLTVTTTMTNDHVIGTVTSRSNTMNINAVQQRTLDYLTSGDGTTDSRQLALNDLIQQGFFVPTDTEYVSEAKIREFAEDKRDSSGFCSEGVDRFLDAVLIEDEDDDEPNHEFVTVTISGTLNVALPGNSPDANWHEENSRISRVVDNIAAAAKMLKGVGDHPYAVSNLRLDWDDKEYGQFS